MSKDKNINKLLSKLDLSAAKDVIRCAFAPTLNMDELEFFQSQDDCIAKLFNDEMLYSVSVVTAKHNDDESSRWIYSVLRSNSKLKELDWKYVHPITRAVYNDPTEVDYSTLPFVA